MDLVRTKGLNYQSVTRRGYVLAAGALLFVGFVFGYAINRPTDEVTAWFAGIAVAVGTAALFLAYPAYRSLRQEQTAVPEMNMQLEFVRATSPPGEFSVAKYDEHVEVAGEPFPVRIHITNRGNAVFRWGILNIQVPHECTITPTDDPQKGHYTSRSTGYSADLADGMTILCRFTVAERDFPPPHDFLYHADVTVGPEKREWPIAAHLDGFPGKGVVARAIVVVPEKPST